MYEKKKNIVTRHETQLFRAIGYGFKTSKETVSATSPAHRLTNINCFPLTLHINMSYGKRHKASSFPRIPLNKSIAKKIYKPNTLLQNTPFSIPPLTSSSLPSYLLSNVTVILDSFLTSIWTRTYYF